MLGGLINGVVDKACLFLLRYSEYGWYQKPESFPAAESSALCHQSSQVLKPIFFLTEYTKFIHMVEYMFQDVYGYIQAPFETVALH